MTTKVYVASSWRNHNQGVVVQLLRQNGIEVYDFKNPYYPARRGGGFAWSEIDPHWETWTTDAFVDALENPIAVEGFRLDFEAMEASDVCVLVLPCGRSAHLEAGWFVGMGRPCYILSAGKEEPELMYRMATLVTVDVQEIISYL